MVPGNRDQGLDLREQIAPESGPSTAGNLLREKRSDVSAINLRKALYILGNKKHLKFRGRLLLCGVQILSNEKHPLVLNVSTPKTASTRRRVGASARRRVGASPSSGPVERSPSPLFLGSTHTSVTDALARLHPLRPRSKESCAHCDLVTSSKWH